MDLVNWLRANFPDVPDAGPITSEQRAKIHAACDEIERLQREVELLKAHPPLLISETGAITPLIEPELRHTHDPDHMMFHPDCPACEAERAADSASDV